MLFIIYKKHNGVSYIISLDGKKVITINPEALMNSKTGRGNLQQCLYHEMGHCFSYSLISNELSSLLNPLETFEDLYNEPPEIINKIRTMIRDEIKEGNSSFFKEFQEVVLRNEAYQRENGFPIERASWQGEESLSENWAEAVSMAAYHGLKDKSSAVLENYNGEPMSYEEWVKRNKILYEYAVEKISKIKALDLNL